MTLLNKKNNSTIFLIGYINLFKNKTGFSFPVFKIDDVICMQDGEDLDAPSEDLLKKENRFFYKLKRPIPVHHNLKNERLSIFVYDNGEEYILISNVEPESLNKIPDKKYLTETELREVEYYRSKSAVYEVSRQLAAVIKKKKQYSPENIPVESLYQFSNELLNSSGSFNIEVFEIWLENTGFFEVLLENCNEHYKILSVWLSLVRFQKLSRADQISIHRNIFPQLISQGDDGLLRLVYYLGIKHKNISLLRDLFDIDFKNEMNLIVEVLETIHLLELEKNLDSTTHINFIVESLENYIRTVKLSEDKPMIKSKLEHLQKLLQARGILESLQELIDSNLLPLVNDGFDSLMEHYFNRSI